MDKTLTPQLTKKLENMTDDDKVHLLARLVIMRQNSQISGLLSRIIGTSGLGLVKSEVVHELYDCNGKYQRRFNYLLNILSSQNPYDNFDTYTLCSYCIYFDVFLNCVKGAQRYSDIKEAFEYAADLVLEKVDQGLLNIGEMPKKFGSLAQKDYRKNIVKYLMNDLKCTDILGLFERFITGESLIEDRFYLKESDEGYYANQVEQYTDSNGEIYYLDAEGNLVEYNEIKDFRYNNFIVRATKHGFVTYNSEQGIEK